MKTYTDMTKKELLECLELASEDAHADAKRQRWTKPVLVEWLEGHAALTDEPVTVVEEPQTDSTLANDEQADADDRTTFEFNGTQYQRKIKTVKRSGRRWARVAKSYVEVLDDGTAVIWKD